MKQAFEQVIRNNVITIGDYTKETRVLIRDLYKEVKELKNMIAAKDKEFVELRTQLSLVQAKLYIGGTV